MTQSCYNLAARSTEEHDRVNIELAESGVAWKERMEKPVLVYEIEAQQPAELRKDFRQRLEYYRNESKRFPNGRSGLSERRSQRLKSPARGCRRCNQLASLTGCQMTLARGIAFL